MLTRASTHLPASDVNGMVAFYSTLGFTLQGEIAERNGERVFAQLALNESRLRIERWNLDNWDVLKEGFAVTTVWLECDDIQAMAAQLTTAGVPYSGPHAEDYGTWELELFDPQGFRVVIAQGD